MLFVAEYTFPWDALATVAAKRLEWNSVRPAGFRFVGEWVWKESEPAFRGVAVVDVDDVESLNAFALHYGATLSLTFRPASDVVTALAQLGTQPPSAGAGRRSVRRLRARRGPRA